MALLSTSLANASGQSIIVFNEDLSHYLYLFSFGCKLNSLMLVDFFIQKVIIRVGRSLQNTPQIYIVEVIYHFKLLMLQIIHTAQHRL